MGVERPRAPKVHHLEEVLLTLTVERQKVRRLDVAMDETVVMGHCERYRRLPNKVWSSAWLERPVMRNEAVEVLAAQVLHRDPRDAVLGETVVEDPHGVRRSER